MPTDYTYTGQYSNVADFGLMYYNARWYDPTIARFAQADTIVPPGVQGLDRYAYVSNNPARYSDPTGHAFDAGGGGGCYPPGSCQSTSSGGGRSNGGNASDDSIVSFLPVLLGYSSITPPPVLFTYAGSAEESSCGNCSVEPPGSAGAAAPGAFVDLYHGLVSVPDSIYGGDVPVYANVATYSSGAVAVPSVTVMNPTPLSIAVAAVQFSVNAQSAGCPDSVACVGEGNYGYGVSSNTPSIFAGGTYPGLGSVVSPYSSADIDLVPSGYPNNQGNRFDRGFTIVVILQDAETGQKFSPVIYPFP